MYTPLGLPGDISYLFVIPLETSGPEGFLIVGLDLNTFSIISMSLQVPVATVVPTHQFSAHAISPSY